MNEKINNVDKEDLPTKKSITPKTLALCYTILLIGGYGLLAYAISHQESFSHFQIGNGHIIRSVGIVVSIIGWLVVILMARLQNYRYLLSALARQFKRGRIPLDEREMQVKRKVYEQSYIVLMLFLIAGGFYLLLEVHRLSFNGFWASRLAVWLWLNLLVLFIFLPSLIAAKNDEQ